MRLTRRLRRWIVQLRIRTGQAMLRRAIADLDRRVARTELLQDRLRRLRADFLSLHS